MPPPWKQVAVTHVMRKVSAQGVDPVCTEAGSTELIQMLFYDGKTIEREVCRRYCDFANYGLIHYRKAQGIGKIEKNFGKLQKLVSYNPLLKLGLSSEGLFRGPA